MINKNLINLLLLSLSVSVIMVIVMPAYNGVKGASGFNLLNMSGVVQSYFKNKNVATSLEEAESLRISALAYLKSYEKVKESNTNYEDKIVTAIPSKKDIIRNINTLAGNGVTNKLKLSDFKFVKPNLNTKDTGSKKTHEISFTVSGDYYDLLKFLEKLENSLEIYSVKNLNITSEKGDSLESTLKYALILETYENTR